MQVQILSGIYSKFAPDLSKSYPLNLRPVVEDSGVSKGYLRTSPGVTTRATGMGIDRGAIVWNGTHYRVSGSSLITVAGNTTTVIGDVGDDGLPVSMAYSFDRLAIASNKKLFYLKNGALTQVTDPDLGAANYVIWTDGYFMTTDGTSLVVTELADPTQVDPLKYGSSEADPDPVVGLLELRGEVYAINRETIEVFSNVGGTGFPFARQRGAQIPKGCVGPAAFSRFLETFAFAGSGRAESPAVYLAGAGQAIKISPRGLDEELGALTKDELARVSVESISGGGNIELYVHLPAVTWVYAWTASQQLDTPVWYRLASGINANLAYLPRNYLFVDGAWWTGSVDGPSIGVFDDAETRHFGVETEYRFDTPLLYNGGAGAIVHQVELVGLFGRSGTGPPATVFLSYTDDGRTWSNERSVSLGRFGERDKRPAWRRCGRMRNWRGNRFRGVIEAPASFMRLEAQVEGLA